MDIYASDEEKAEAIKQWWRDNGRSVVAGVVIGAVAIFGFRYWLNFQQVQSEQASMIYQQTVVQLRDAETDKAQNNARILMQDYGSTAYAVLAALEMADMAADNNDKAAAKEYLSWVVDAAKLTSHQELAKLRLARIYVSEGNYSEATAMIEAAESEAFASLFAELEGDIKLAQGDTSAAHAAYQRAILALSPGEPRQMLLQMKIDDAAAPHEG